MSSAQSYENSAWEALEKGHRVLAIRYMRDGARVALGKGRSNRMKDYADAIEETQLKTKTLIIKWLNNEIDPEDKADF